MTFRYTTLYVTDVKKTLAFYEKAFGLATHFLHESGGYGELESGQTKLGFAAHETAAQLLGVPYNRTTPGAPPPGFEIGLGVDDARAAFDRAVAAGAAAVRPPAPMPWGQTIAYVRDPDGALIVLVQGD